MPRLIRFVLPILSLWALFALGGWVLSGCRDNSQAAETIVIQPPARLSPDVLYFPAPANIQSPALPSQGESRWQTGIRKFYSAQERKRITHATIRVPD